MRGSPLELGEVLRKERERIELDRAQIAAAVGVAGDVYDDLESSRLPVQEWFRKLTSLAIQLEIPTSRLISPTGRSCDAAPHEGKLGALIWKQREQQQLSLNDLADQANVPADELTIIEIGQSPLE